MWTEIGTGDLPHEENDTHCLILCIELLNTARIMSLLYENQRLMELTFYKG